MRRLLGALVGTSLAVALFASPSPAVATPTAPDRPAGTAGLALLDPSRPFAAAGEGSLLRVDVPALSPALLPQTNVALAHTRADADSDADLDAAKDGNQFSHAVGGVTYDSNLLGQPLDVQSHQASAPANDVSEGTLIPVDILPLLDLPVIQSHAEASWGATALECVAADTPMSAADQTAADVTLIAPADGQSLVALNTNEGEGAVDTQVSTHLVSIPGPGDPRAVQARTTSNVSSANILNGIGGPGSAIEVDVVQTPDYVVQASGLPGGASVTGDRPVVNVTIAGEPLITLDDTNQTETATLTDIVLGDLIDTDDPDLLEDIVDDLSPELAAALEVLLTALDTTLGDLLGTLEPGVRLSIPYEEQVAADGTSASVAGAILRVEVLPPGVQESPLEDLLQPILDALYEAIGLDEGGALVDVHLGPVGAAVQAPAGGIDCSSENDPLRELNKHASAQEVAPGGTFDYSISVPNRGPCTVTDVVVTDEITGPGFEVIATEPEATVEGGTVTWEIGDLAPNETAELTITVKVAEDAPDGATFDDVVTATGTCNGQPVEEEEPLLDTPTVRDDFTGECSVQFSNKDASHESVTPGQTFAYYVHVFNSGAEPCAPVDVVDTLDDRVSFVSCNYGCENDGQEVSWSLDSLAGGSSVVLSVVVQVADDASGTLENTAIITPGNGDPKTVTHSGPTIGEESIPKDPLSPIRGGNQQQGPLPTTGREVPVALAALLAGVGLVLFRARRLTT